ncbi:MAG: hypothetical protein K6C34_01335, partial [Alphaproteobacteria bacterium]|nr:hypothetical protein [Alphaproteobacteria bacterium]
KEEDEIDQLEKEFKNCSLENSQESLQKKSFFLDYIHSSLITDLFGQAQLIFLPHHGTNTENSQRYLGSLKNESKERTFVVNSSPFGPQHLPKKSTWELAPKVPVHPEHPFSFGHDNSETVSMKLTTKPIYVTGIAPCGMYCFRISDKFENDGIYMLNLFNEPYSWFNVVPKCSSIRNSH